MPKNPNEEAINSIGLSKLIIPIIIGVFVIIYFLMRKFKWSEFKTIPWTDYVYFWVGMSLFFLIIRHLAYAARLWILSEKEFTYFKCIELIFIWEFSSAVSPTAVGGSAAALFVLSQEKLATARVTAIVLYTAVLDTIFFVFTLPVLLILFGTHIIRPGLSGFSNLDTWGYSFIFAYIFMAIYGVIFFYGLFIKPEGLKRLVLWITSFKIFKRWREKAVKLGDDFVVASREMAGKGFGLGIPAFLATSVAWSSRFILLNFLIIAFERNLPLDLWTQGALYGRLEAMFVIMAFSPTPGSAGVAEILFNGFLSDYISNETSSSLIALIWRFFTYYSYLIIGAFIIPNWLRKVLKKKKNESTP